MYRSETVNSGLQQIRIMNIELCMNVYSTCFHYEGRIDIKVSIMLSIFSAVNNILKCLPEPAGESTSFFLSTIKKKRNNQTMTHWPMHTPILCQVPFCLSKNVIEIIQS